MTFDIDHIKLLKSSQINDIRCPPEMDHSHIIVEYTNIRISNWIIKAYNSRGEGSLYRHDNGGHSIHNPCLSITNIYLEIHIEDL